MNAKDQSEMGCGVFRSHLPSLSTKGKNMWPVTARFLEERVRDAKEKACLRCPFVYQGRVLPIMDCKIGSEVACPRNLCDTTSGLRTVYLS
jgi:hypothetical protein